MSDPKYFDEYAERARMDAVRDMMAESTSAQYTASYMVRHFETDEVEHGIIKQNAGNVHEAIGLMYLEVMEDYNPEEGWSPPSLVLDDVFYAFEGSDQPTGPCGTCGDPNGPCNDPNMCIQNPGGYDLGRL